MSYDKIDKSRGDESRRFAFEKPSRNSGRPFDTRELDSLPQPTDDDPPYRPWWVVDR
jgi:hypothetical protein